MYKKHQLKINTTKKKRFHIFSLFALACVIICFVILVSLVKTHNQWNQTGVYNKGLYYEKQEAQQEKKGFIAASLMFRREKKPNLIYLDDTGYKIADQQPNNIQKEHIRSSIWIGRRENDTLSAINPKIGPYYSSIEHDATIDENALPETYKFYLNENFRTSQCSSGNPIKNVVFLRSHRTASHTISNLFYRYGEINGLFFALPNAPTFQYYWPLRFHHSYVAKDLLNKNAPNFVINVARNNKNNLKSLVSKETLNVAIVRHPVPHFQSIYEYVDVSYYMEMVFVNDTNHFSKFLEDPKRRVAAILNHTQAFHPSFYLLKNAQLFDLGYEDQHYQTSLDLQFIIHQLEEQIDFVLVNEYMEESLVLLQRQLCWQLSDMIYISQRVRRKHEDISEEDKRAILEWNKEDFVLYNHFNETLFKRLREQDGSFWADVHKLKDLLKTVKEECVEEPEQVTKDHQFDGKNNSVVNNVERNQSKSSVANSSNVAGLFDESFELEYKLRQEVQPEMKRTCHRLLLPEKDYIKLLKNIQKVIISEDSKHTMTNKYVRNSTEGNFYYIVPLNPNNVTAVEDSAMNSNGAYDVDESKEITFGNQED